MFCNRRLWNSVEHDCAINLLKSRRNNVNLCSKNLFSCIFKRFASELVLGIRLPSTKDDCDLATELREAAPNDFSSTLMNARDHKEMSEAQHSRAFAQRQTLNFSRRNVMPRKRRSRLELCNTMKRAPRRVMQKIELAPFW